MGGVDKLFAPLAGRPLLAHTLSAFQRCPRVQSIVLVASGENIERAAALVRDERLDKVAKIVAGGRRRQDSVRAGLQAIGACDWVLVHDGARPLVSPELIERAMETARETGAAAPVVPLVDTVKEVAEDGTVASTVDRSRLRAVQTPQAFRYDLLLRAHDEVTADVTDDAAMLETLGLPVKTFPGDRRNIKVTTPDDLALAEAQIGRRLPR
jgi:2-C-methyl-D-erythritol 4-phosphate cytidylyltransferase